MILARVFVGNCKFRGRRSEEVHFCYCCESIDRNRVIIALGVKLGLSRKAVTGEDQARRHKNHMGITVGSQSSTRLAKRNITGKLHLTDFHLLYCNNSASYISLPLHLLVHFNIVATDLLYTTSSIHSSHATIYKSPYYFVFCLPFFLNWI